MMPVIARVSVIREGPEGSYLDELKSGYWDSTLRQRVSRRTVLRGAGLAGAGLAGAALIGCGGDDDDDPAPTAAATQAGSGTAAATEAMSAVKKGGRLALSQVGDPATFDLHSSSTVLTAWPTSMYYNQLLRFDPAIADETPEAVIGDLAQSWEISPDGQTYTFRLQPDVKFHDGTPFTSQDARASYQRQLDRPADLKAPPRGDQLKVIGAMQTPDDHTLVMTMSRPVSSLSMLPILAQGWMAMYSKKDIDGGFDYKKGENGTGPYRQGSYQPGAKISNDKNPDYWVQGQPYLDGVDMFIVPDASTTLANFQAGELHVYSPNVENLDTITKTLGDRVTTAFSKGINYSTMNYGGRAPWTDERVRQAVSMAHDRQGAIDVLVFGSGRLSGYMQGEGYWAVSEEELHEIPGYERFGPDSVAEARKMLDAAGVPESMDGEILVRQRFYENLSLYTQDTLKQLGINVVMNSVETATAYDLMTKKDFDLAPWGHGMALDDPDAIFAEFYLEGSARNYSQISSPAVGEAFLKQSVEQDPEMRRELVKDLQKVAMPLHGKSIFYSGNGRQTHWNFVKGFTPGHSSSYNSVRWQETWLDK